MRRPGRGGNVVPTVLAFAATALVLEYVALHAIYLGPHAGTPRRTVFAGVALAVALIVVAISVDVVVGAATRGRRLQRLLRIGESVVGSFAARLIEPGADPTATSGEAVTFTLTNQRLLVQRPEAPDPPWLDLEHEQVVDARDAGPVLRGHLGRCQLVRLQLADGRALLLRMNAATALDFLPVRGQYLEPQRRHLRALVVAAEGPTPARRDEPLSTILADGAPTVCLLELGEHYLQVIREDSAPLDDLYYCFHWEQITVGDLQPPNVPGYPDSWRRLRLVLNGGSVLTLCGTAAATARLRTHALTHGARAG